MDVFFILGTWFLWLAFYFLVAAGALSFVIALCGRKWKLALWAGVVLAVVIGTAGIFLEMNDPFIRHDVDFMRLVGDYHLNDPETRKELATIGYKDFSGELMLNQDGTFSAKKIPGCCIRGLREAAADFKGGYYDLEGHWKIGLGTLVPSDVRVVMLDWTSCSISEAAFADNAASEVPAPSQPLRLKLMKPPSKGAAIALGFEVFDGEYDYVIYSAP